MNSLNRGSKHTCPDCEIKYYDLGKEAVVCPRCGAKPAVTKVLKTARPIKKTGRMPSGRYPHG